jgi:peptidoglycan hydrolase CwlO-like protein
MILERHYRIAEFLRDEFNKLEDVKNDKKIKSNFYKQRKHRYKIQKLLLKVEDFLFKVDSLDAKTIEELKNLQGDIKDHLG